MQTNPVKKEVLVKEHNQTNPNGKVEEPTMNMETIVCLLCGKRFLSRGSLQRHASNHSEVKKFTCDICEKEFARKDVFKKHVTVHKDNSDVSFNCNVCSKSFRWKHSFERHERNVHGMAERETVNMH